ncbi:MAG: hypothetical protein KDF59_15935 [Nitrosomonas sp.]|nr:hypothetical protein [Nitrosomonas sp.]
MKVKVKDGEIHIIFNAKGWNIKHTELLRGVIRDAENLGIPVVDHLEVTFKEKARETERPENYERWIRLLDKLAEAEQADQSDDPDIGSPR